MKIRGPSSEVVEQPCFYCSFVFLGYNLLTGLSVQTTNIYLLELLLWDSSSRCSPEDHTHDPSYLFFLYILCRAFKSIHKIINPFIIPLIFSFNLSLPFLHITHVCHFSFYFIVLFFYPIRSSFRITVDLNHFRIRIICKNMTVFVGFKGRALLLLLTIYVLEG